MKKTKSDFTFDKEVEDAVQAVVDSIQVVKPACKYIIGKWVVDEKGLWRNGDVEIDFVKGVQNDNSEYRQGGVISEELIALCIKNLSFLNVGKFENEYTTEAIGHLKNALKCIKMRIIDRQRRGVYGHSKK